MRFYTLSLLVDASLSRTQFCFQHLHIRVSASNIASLHSPLQLTEMLFPFEKLRKNCQLKDEAMTVNDF